MGEWDAPVKPVNTKKRRWPRILGIVGGSLALLLIVAYFVVTSAWFLKAVVLPKAGAVINATITVEDASVSPFSAITLVKRQVPTTGPEPLLRVEKVHARYSLWAILRGHIEIGEVTIDSPVVQFVENADGASNLDPILKALRGEPRPNPSDAVASEPLHLHLQKAALNNVTLRYVKSLRSGERQVAEITKLNLTADDIANEGTGKLGLSTEFKFDQGLASPTNAVVTAKLSGQFSVALDADLKPASVKGGIQLGVSEAYGPFQSAAGVAATLDTDITPTEIRSLALRFLKGTTPLGTITVSGPFNPAQLEGRLNLDLAGIDRELLNIAGTMFGGDFNGTTINSSNVVELAQGAKAITVNGQVAVNQFKLTLKGQSTPTLDLATTYSVAVDQVSKRASLGTFTVSAAQNQAPLFRGTLAKPMFIDWSGAANAVEESSFDLALTNLNLADWRAFAPDLAPAGSLDLQLRVLAQQAGKKLKLDFNTHLAGFAARFASNRIDAADLTLALRAEVDDFNRINLTSFDARVAHQNQPALSLGASGQVDVKTMDLDLRTSATIPLPGLAALLGNPDIKVSSGALKFDGHVVQKNATPGQPNALYDRTVAGTLHLDELTGNFAAYSFDRFAVGADFDVSLKNQVAEIKALTATLKQSGRDGGTLGVTGAYDLAKSNGQVTLRLLDLNQSVVRSFAAPFLASNKLESVSISLNAAASFDPQAGSALKGDFQVGNLVLSDAQNRFPKTPTALLVKLDGAFKDDIAELRQCVGSIQQGTLQGGGFDANGRFNLKTKVGRVALKLTDLNQNVLQPFLASALGDRTLTSVSIGVNADATYDPQGDSSVKGEFQVLNFLITDPKGQLPQTPLTAIVKLDGSLHDNLAEIRQFVGYVKQGDLLGGTFDATGNYHLTNQAGQLELRLTDLNQHALAPFLAGTLGDKKLEAVSIKLTSTARYDPKGESAVKADFQVSNLLIKDPSGTLPATPLAFGLQLDGSLDKQVIDLRQCQLTLSETPRAKNQFQLAGTVDMTRSNAIAGHLKLTADSLDLTPCYDMFASGKTITNQVGTAKQEPGSAAARVEPAPIHLPFGSFLFDTAIGHLYLREIDVAGFAATVKIEGNNVAIDPFGLTLNGAPVSLRAIADLGVTGYEYDVGFSADRLPIEPVLNSFEIGQRGQIQGFLIASTAIKGAGITAPSLQNHLAGNASVTLTNAVIQLTGPSSGDKDSGTLLSALFSGVFKTVAVVLQLPDLTRSPVEFLDARAEVSNGTVNLRSLFVQSPLFRATSAGTISLADPLEASRLNDLPLDLALERNTAIKARLASVNTDASLAYVNLPSFVKVGGTLAKADVKTDLAVLALKVGSDAIKGVVGGILPGGAATVPGAAPAVPSVPQIPSSFLPQAPKAPLPTKPGLFDLLK